MTQTLEKTVRDIAVECPASVRVFEELGIDYCCGGRKSLRDACLSANVPVERAIELLNGSAQAAPVPDDTQWNSAPLDALTTHIVQKHHAYVRQELPRLNLLLAKVTDRHGSAHPELHEVGPLFTAIAQELSIHMMKEEHVLFPYIDSMAQAYQVRAPLPPACFSSVERPIANMLADHDDAGAILSQMRQLTNGYTVPEGACTSFSVLYHGLHDFERDLHQHIHLENNILFPRAIEMERIVA
jgi:regulator of cell morphogenesis and NO signaling